jgi:ferric-dicitrate binding protein FerR (iron transport regulator)
VKIIILALLAGIILSLPLSALAQAQPESVGSVAHLGGSPKVERSGQQQIVAVSMPVFLKDEFVTGPADSLVITLAAGWQLIMGHSTTQIIDQKTVSAGGQQSIVIKVLSGAMRFISGEAPEHANLRVISPNAIATTRGTEFEVDVTQGSTRPGYGGCGTYTDVKVSFGTVTVANVSDPDAVVSVHEGYATTVPCSASPLTPGPAALVAIHAGPSAGAAAPPPVCPVCPVMGGHHR